MKIIISRATDEMDCRDAMVIRVDGKIVFSAFDGEPEDNSLCRNFSDCFGIGDLMKQAFEASTDRQSLEITDQEITWEEICGLW